MTLAKRLSISFAAIATALTVGALGSAPAQAITINGSVTGTWDFSYVDGGIVNVGDTFTADYSYDDATLTFFDSSQPGVFQYFGYNVFLLSLIVNSGSYSHTFDFSNGYGQFTFIDADISTTYDRKYKEFTVFGRDNTAPKLSEFSAVKQAGESGSEPFNYSSAQFFSYDNNAGHYLVDASTFSNVQFTPDPTAVPAAVSEPSLLAGLIGLGVGVLRKRKAEAAKQTSEV